MFIESVHIENFRSIKDGEVQFGDVTCFVGRNGVGKSTVLYALDTFYNVGAQYSQHDYYNHQQADTSIRIRVTYGRLTPTEIDEFGGYVQGGKLTVTKVINQGGARYYGTTAQIPQFADCRKLGAREKRTALKALIDNGQFADFPDFPRNAEELEQVMKQYEEQHPDLTQPTDSEGQFFGLRNVGGGKLDKFTKFVMVPAVKDAASEMEKRGAIMQLLDLIVTRSINSRGDFIEFKREFEERARQLYARANIPELSELGRMVTARLSRYAPGAELLIDFADLAPPAIPLPDAVVTVSEDNFKVPVKYSGHGLQRALILALLEQLSMTRPPAVQQEPGEQGEIDEPAPLPNLILAVEEPELYLHPARSRYLATILRELAAVRGDDGSARTQVVMVTHSPYFVDVEHFDEVRMCRKVPAATLGDPRVTSFSSYTRLQAAQRLAAITGRDPATFTAMSFVSRAAPVLNSLVNEGLFADVVVIVEGESDVVTLWSMQKRLGKNWDELGVVVVPISGKSKMDRAVVAFQGFGIPTYFMFDGDRTDNQERATNRILLQLGGAQSVDFPPTTVTPAFAVFEEDIEDYLRTAAGPRFEPLRLSCAALCGNTRPATALKNAEVMQAFLSAAGDEGIEFDMLGEIVEHITVMARQLRTAPPAAAEP